MCGIVGFVGSKKGVRVLTEGLERLEYRGYDSAGVAYLKDGKVNVVKEEGKLSNLKEKLNLDDEMTLGIGHTRWATHGKANATNAHPHKMGKFTVVHNGIIENYNVLRSELEKKGYVFKSETDTEVICTLLDYMYKDDKDVLSCINKLNKMLDGSYALGIICEDDKDNLYLLKNKSPLIVGVNDNEKYIASDAPAILDKTKKNIILDDGDYARLSGDKVELFNDGKKKEYQIKEFMYDADAIDKKGYEHFMLKEMHEQPDVFKKTTNPYLKEGVESLLNNMPDFTKYNKIRIVACGSATHAGLVGKCMLEEYANVRTVVDTASEFRYNKQFLEDDELVIVISQSGETADTFEALKIANKNGNDTLGIINEKGSSIAREAKMVLYTEAGKEIAVATTKAYSAQVALLTLIALNIAENKKTINKKEMIKILEDSKLVPGYIEELLSMSDIYKTIAEEIKDQNDIFFIGRKIDYALAQEGSLKLKEISYTHSEAYAAGELKHGTISLIEEGTPVIAIVTDDSIAPKTINNIKEVKTRGANVIYITNRKKESDIFYDRRIIVPEVHKVFEPLLTIIPLQMTAYYLAKIKGCPIDQPRNLAKSVTVE